jgi:hypothetical protein
MTTKTQDIHLAHIQDILSRIVYKDWTFKTGIMGDGSYIQACFMASDNNNPDSEPTAQCGSKWYVSTHAIDQEVVRTAFKAIRDAEFHELCEQFLYRGVRIFNPHMDPEAVVALSRVAGDHVSVGRDDRHRIDIKVDNNVLKVVNDGAEG